MTTTADATAAAMRAEAPLPAGFRIELDPDTKQLTDSILFGGSPVRAMRLSAAGCRALAELRAGPVSSAAAGILARRLTDAGMAQPRPPAGIAALDVTVLIPVRDRPAQLRRCLAAVGGRYPVIVVDDGSADAAAIEAVTASHGATLRRLPVTAGPAAARNVGLASVGTDLVAFLDSDCEPPAGWLEQLAAHMRDPVVGGVAPRIVGPDVGAGARPSAASAAARYATACSSLDLGPREARVVPGSRVAYVPTAALLVRRAAIESLPGGSRPFDEALRYGEDVDLIWRLHDGGWRIRYEPAVAVSHEGPQTWQGVLDRRFHYGTSAAPLARRHPRRLAPLALQPWPALTVAALLARRPVTAAAAAFAGWLSLTQTVTRAGLPADGAAAASLTAIRQTWLGTGRYVTQFAAPALALALTSGNGRSATNTWGRRAAVASLLLGPALDDWSRRRQSGLDPVRFTLGRVADDMAYGAGVWAGCVRERTLTPITPVISWRPLRMVGLPQQQKGRT